jgi:hypothetical protein
MGVTMKELAIVVAAALAITVAFWVLVDFANAIETTTLDDALERPVVVQKYVDKENDVVCYWTTRYPRYLSCIQIMPNLKRGNAK